MVDQGCVQPLVLLRDQHVPQRDATPASHTSSDIQGKKSDFDSEQLHRFEVGSRMGKRGSIVAWHVRLAS